MILSERVHIVDTSPLYTVYQMVDPPAIYYLPLILKTKAAERKPGGFCFC